MIMAANLVNFSRKIIILAWLFSLALRKCSFALRKKKLYAVGNASLNSTTYIWRKRTALSFKVFYRDGITNYCNSSKTSLADID